MRIQHESSIRGKNRIQLVRVGEPLFGRGCALVQRIRVAKRAAKQRKKMEESSVLESLALYASCTGNLERW
jgi:hypothetical protein